MEESVKTHAHIEGDASDAAHDVEGRHVEIVEDLLALPTADIDLGILQLLNRVSLPPCFHRVLIMQELDEPGQLVATHIWDSPQTDASILPRERVFPIDTYSWRQAAVAGREVVVDRSADGAGLTMAEQEYLDHWGITNLVALPLQIAHVEHAMLLAVSLQGPERTPQSTLDLLRSCARVIGQLLTRRQREEHAHVSGMHDGNRRSIDESGTWEWDLRTDAVWLSEQWCQMVGEVPGSVENNAQLLRKYIHPDDLARVWDLLGRCVADPAVEYKIRYRVLHPDGSVRWIYSRGFATERDADGRALRLTGADLDITGIMTEEDELRRSRDALATALHELEAAWRFKQEFLTNISHEFRTPLTGILGAVDIMRMADPLTERQRTQLGRIEDRSRDLLGMIEDLIDVSVFEERGDTLAREDVALDAVYASVLKLVRRRAARRHVKVVSDLPDHPVFVEGDPVRLRQMALNLLLHMVMTSQEHGVVTLELSRDATSHEACLDLRTDAPCLVPGVSVPALRRTPLADVLAIMHSSGETLPLSLVQHIVTLHEGIVLVDVQPDTGTRVTVRLPLAGAD